MRLRGAASAALAPPDGHHRTAAHDLVAHGADGLVARTQPVRMARRRLLYSFGHSGRSGRALPAGGLVGWRTNSGLAAARRWCQSADSAAPRGASSGSPCQGGLTTQAPAARLVRPGRGLAPPLGTVVGRAGRPGPRPRPRPGSPSAEWAEWRLAMPGECRESWRRRLSEAGRRVGCVRPSETEAVRPGAGPGGRPALHSVQSAAGPAGAGPAAGAAAAADPD